MMVTSAAFGGCITPVVRENVVAAIWRFLTLAQELLLLSLVNTDKISGDLIMAYEGGSFFNFGFFDMPFKPLSQEYQGQTDYNALDNNFVNHPTLVGKMFIVNFRSDVCFTFVVIVGYAICFLLGRRIPYARKMADSFVFSGIIYTIQASFIDLVLCSAVQILYVSHTHIISPSRHQWNTARTTQ